MNLTYFYIVIISLNIILFPKVMSIINTLFDVLFITKTLRTKTFKTNTEMLRASYLAIGFGFVLMLIYELQLSLVPYYLLKTLDINKMKSVLGFFCIFIIIFQMSLGVLAHTLLFKNTIKDIRRTSKTIANIQKNGWMAIKIMKQITGDYMVINIIGLIQYQDNWVCLNGKELLLEGNVIKIRSEDGSIQAYNNYQDFLRRGRNELCKR